MSETERELGWWRDKVNKYSYVGIILIILSGIAVLSGCVVFFRFLFLLSEYYSIGFSDKESLERAAQTGDFVAGIIGTVWSLAGVILFFLALRMQSKELSLQIKELKETKDVFVIQQKAIKLQQFETTFFNLIKNWKEILNDISLGNSNGKAVLGQYIRSVQNELVILSKKESKEFVEDLQRSHMYAGRFEVIKKKYSFLNIETENLDEEAYLKNLFVHLENLRKLDKVRIAYKIVYEKKEYNVDQYFRYFYHILSYVKNEEENIKKLDKDTNLVENFNNFKRYTDLLQAQTSTSELRSIFYNGLCFPKSYELLEHYNFLENLPVSELINQSHVHFYPNTKFKNRSTIISV